MKMRKMLLVALLLGWALPASAQAIKLEFRNGRVNLSTQNAPLRAILVEWARLGGTTIVNGDRVPGAPVTIELAGVSERQAIDILLRGAAGYIVGPRPGGSTAASTFASILILATSTPAARQAASSFVQSPQRPQPQDRDPDPEPEDTAITVEREAEDRPTPASIRQEAEEAARRRVAERRAQIFVGDQVVEEPPAPVSARPPAQGGGNPFGLLPGAVRPGVITPGPEPQQQDNRRRPADPQP